MKKQAQQTSEQLQLSPTTEQGGSSLSQTKTPMDLMQIALERGAVDQLEKLMQLQKDWEDRQARKDFFYALSEFQMNCPSLQKMKGVSHDNGKTIKYKYIPLAQVQETIREPLHKSGLSFRWEIEDKGEMLNVTCVLTHLNGHAERTSMSAKADDSGSKNAIQARGSTITYLQRYTLIGALGISSADVDNDGGKQKADTDPEWIGEGKKATDEQMKATLTKIINGTVTLEIATKHFSFKAKDYKAMEIAAKNAKPKVEIEPS